MPRLHPAEWLTAAYFCYVAAIAPWFPSTRARVWQAWALAALIVALTLWWARKDSRWRDWMPLLFTLTAYRQMDWFTPAVPDGRLDRAWIGWDRWLLDQHGWRAAIESLGGALPGALELCYMLVYGVAPLAVWVLWAHGRRDRVPRWWLAYLAGTLGAYALLPFFPSQPPRTAFPGQDLPQAITLFRRINLEIVGAYGIHSSVFPSAHVSSVFAAAWGLLATLQRRRWIGWSTAAYGSAVGVAAVYGRYHYAVDIAGGAAMSLAGVVALWVFRAGNVAPAEAEASAIGD